MALTGEAGEQVPPLLLLAPGQHALHAAAARGHVAHDRDLGHQAARRNTPVSSALSTSEAAWVAVLRRAEHRFTFATAHTLP